MSVASLEKFKRQFEKSPPETVSELLRRESEGTFSFFIPAADSIDAAALTDRIEKCLPALLNVVNEPYIVLKNEYRSVRTELADAVTPQGIQMTVKDPKLWKLKNGKLRPEYIYSKSREDEYNTYENRFVRALIDKTLRFLNLPMENAKDGIKTMYEAYFQHTSLNKLDLLKLIDSDLYKTSDSHSFDDYKKLFYLRGKLSQLRNSAFYKIMMQFPAFTGKPETTNLFIHNPDYNACMRLWLYLDAFHAGLSLLSAEERKSVYKAFILLAMAGIYVKYGFCITKDVKIGRIDENFSVKNLELENGIFKVLLETEGEKINVHVQCDKIRARQKTSIGIHTDIDQPYEKDNQFTVSLHRTDYTDRTACVIPGNKNSLKDLESIVRCTVFAFEAEKEIYDKLCLICGSNALDDKEYYYQCEECGAVYCFPDRNTVWINQFNTLSEKDE